MTQPTGTNLDTNPDRAPDMTPDLDTYFICVAPSERWGIAHTLQHALDYGDFVWAALAAGRTGNGVFGAKLMWGTHAELTSRLADLHPDLAGDEVGLLEREFGTRLRFVHLRRDDTLAQAVSWLRAEQTGVWFVGGRGEIGGARSASAAGRPSYDRDAVTRILRTVEEHDAGWRRWFESHGVEPYRVRYEDLSADPEAVTLRVLDHLGLTLPAGRRITPSHQRQADRLNEEWAARYRLPPPPL
ncbi:Stf0 family sulfotransferase [Streptomyces sp. NPDC101175]|uniref:Stf0 family sulfotransferase n=1 Tax=Streptomyces sp. NPDC101175 TaxID=3366123 RepID=UPI003832A593